MKKLAYLCVALLGVALFSCSNDDEEAPKAEKVISFETALKPGQSEFIADGIPTDEGFQKTSFSDPEGLATFTHEYADWGDGYSFAAFTYMNKTGDETSAGPIGGKGKTGTVYMAVYNSGGKYGNHAVMTINRPEYAVKGAWIANSTIAYNDMVNGSFVATAFKKGSWYKVTAYGLDAADKKIAQTEVYLAKYQSDNDKPANDWIWFDLTPLQGAVKVYFEASSSDSYTDPDTGEEYMNTAAYFCLDGITLVEK